MATPTQVTPIYYAQLNNDAREQTLAAGSQWPQHPLAFFYATEVGVDFGVRATMSRILMFEHATLPEALWINLANAINRGTLAGDAVGIIAQISTGANHH
jgi:hypothetical protein